MSPLYLSYYTIGDGYEAHGAELVRSLDRFKLSHQVAGVRPGTASELGREPWTWARAAQYKAEFIRDMLRRYPDRPLVWLDADARVVARPIMFEWLDCDFAAHWYRGRELLSSTLYLRPGPGVTAVVEAWIDRNRDRPGRRCADQPNLQDVVESSHGLKVVNLPPEYAWIDAGSGFDLSSRTYGYRSPVIVQLQASRKLRNARSQRAHQSPRST